MSDLSTAIEYLKGVGPGKAELLQKELKIFRFEDLLRLFPYRYVDRSRFHKISELYSADTEVQIIGKIVHVEEVKGKGNRSRLVARFGDDTGEVELVWFKGVQYIRKSLSRQEPYVLFGKPSVYGNRLNFAHPELEKLSEFKASPQKGLQPVYPSTEKLSSRGLNNRGMARLTRQLIPQVIRKIPEIFPADFVQQHQLMARPEAFAQVHFPQSTEKLEEARRRLKFEELLLLQISFVRQKQLHDDTTAGFPFPQVGEQFNNFYQNALPFDLTEAQKRVMREIRSDVGKGKHMNRLLQGDVGSGKTVVALMAMLLAIDNGYQACLMAPTEILATQHYNGLWEMLESLPVEIALLTGSTKSAERRKIHEKLQSGGLHILIGTHALIEDKVKFKNLGLAVVDEQHRFGVAQRAKLWKKNSLPPHVLVMTATPIPRTLAMTVYGNLDVSVIDELPPGRKPVDTRWASDKNRLKVFKFMEDEIAKGRQVYVVYPLIEESEAMDYKDLMDGYASVERYFPKPKYQVSIVHGRMNAGDKEYEMQRFVKGESQIMVATTVIEVGVNVPNASVMVIESAERFGLSQLHQLRGRVGRGAEKSYCILMSGVKLSNDAKKRLRTMTETNDGFKIAEVDMKLRGPGNMAGTQQSGVLNLQLADLNRDQATISETRAAAKSLLQSDPRLESPQHRLLRRELERQKGEKIEWGRIS